MSNEDIKLKYIGDGAFLPNVPARDLTEKEAREYGGVVELLKSGLYERVDKPEEKKPAEKEGK